jgi:hypothetical protein
MAVEARFGLFAALTGNDRYLREADDRYVRSAQ